MSGQHANRGRSRAIEFNYLFLVLGKSCCGLDDEYFLRRKIRSRYGRNKDDEASHLKVSRQAVATLGQTLGGK